MTQWKLVPVVADKDMKQTFMDTFNAYGFESAYRDLLAAAPHPPSEPHVVVEVSKYGKRRFMKCALPVGTHNLYLHPPIPAVPESEVTDTIAVCKQAGYYAIANLIERLTRRAE